MVPPSGAVGLRSSIGLWGSVAHSARPVLRELLVNGPQTRTQLARTLGMSTGSLTRLTKPLVHSGLVVERGVVHDPDNGRPTRPLDVAADKHRFLGVKITADRLHAVTTDLRARVLRRADEPLDSRDPADVCARIAGLNERLAAGGPAHLAVGVSLGGHRQSADPAGPALFDAPFLGWEGAPLPELLARALPVPCTVENDVFALAQAQAWFGGGRDLTDFALLTVGAGIGYALVVQGRALPLTPADQWEFSHHVLDPGGPMCPEGHRGCVGAYLSTRSILGAAAHGLHRAVTLDEVIGLARQREPVALGVVSLAAWALGATIATIANVSLVKNVVIGGELVALADEGRQHIEDGLAQRRHRDHRALTLSLLPADFTEWARAAAAAPIRSLILNEG
ncbi:ROK family transcriptional regulator [Streptomyces marincola]|uniref:ROK family transcriptional regulator n=1 Tax=Streptomyces marincola TaxID=2878388 RepID=UPI001CF30231|nr:ROK family transcriptional regulator [Streptomyces marincola]UCM90481.1 ROK family transcriptional regulator [Streptomyces marincola]